MMFFSHRGTELTEKNQSPELPGLRVLRASVANSVFLSSLDGASHPSRLRASGRPFGKLRVNGRYKNHKRKHRWRGKLAATKTGTGVPIDAAIKTTNASTDGEASSPPRRRARVSLIDAAIKTQTQ